MTPQTLSTDSVRLPKPQHRRAGRHVAAAAVRVPEDSALYLCECGEGFTAAVTTSVTCPSCGHGQAW
jgi:Zn finger protein HypA/HybF involved in hydrogenase expression